MINCPAQKEHCKVRNTKYEIRDWNAKSMDLKKRYKDFAIAVAELIQVLPKNTINSAYSNQLVRSSSSPGTNYRAALRGKSTADFINKLKIVEEELDESIYFLELIEHFNSSHINTIIPLVKEGNELLAITVASLKTARANMVKSRNS
jgi:four helix bundle protein